jgi:hypothetical protein
VIHFFAEGKELGKFKWGVGAKGERESMSFSGTSDKTSGWSIKLKTNRNVGAAHPCLFSHRLRVQLLVVVLHVYEERLLIYR